MKDFLVIIICPDTKKDIKDYTVKANYGWQARDKAKILFKNDIKYIPSLKKLNYNSNSVLFDSIEV